MSRTFKVTICAAHDQPGAVKTIDATWAELKETFKDVEETDCNPCQGKKCLAKRGKGWLPVALKKPYRTDENVEAITLAVPDLDALSDADFDVARARLAELGYQRIVHATHSDARGARCLRVVMPLSRPVSPREWRTLFPALVAHLALPGLDEVCNNPSRLFFGPRRPKGAGYFVEAHEGAEIDVEMLLAHKPALAAPAVAATETTPNHDDDVPVELAGLRGTLYDVEKSKARNKAPDPLKQANEKTLAEMLKRIRKGLPIAVPGDFRGETGLPRGRDDALNRALSCMAFNLPPQTPWEAVAEIMRETIFAMALPEGVQHWMAEAKDMYARAQRRRDEADAANASMKASMSATIERIRKGRGAKEVADAVADAVADDPDAWKMLLEYDAKGKLKSHNVGLILTFDPETRGFIRWNDVTRKIEVSGGSFEDSKTLDTDVTDWLAREYGIEVADHVVGKRILAVARKSSYDPIKDYLRSVTWDGTPRVDTWLLDYCAAVTVDEDGEDITQLVKLIGTKFLLSLVKRGLEPGCKVDDVMVLEGAQSIKKSTALRVLGGEWFTDDKINMSDKDSKLLAARTWVMEFAELASLRKSDIETVKNFLTQERDTLRPPYASSHEEFPRRCVFAGTVNPIAGRGYLSDETGNRRFRPVRCEGQINTDGIRAIRDQLFAEAVARIDAGERWWYDAQENAAVEARITDERVETSPTASMTEEICRWWHSLSPKPGSVLMSDVVRGVFPNERHDERKIGKALSDAGFKRRRYRSNGKRTYCYVPGGVEPIGPAVKVPTLRAVANTKVAL